MTGYILGESAGETARLTTQVQRDPIEGRLLWAGLAPGMRVLDAGCGPGETTRTVARLVGPTGSVAGYDISPARIEAARSRPASEGSAPVAFDVGDVRALPCAERSFDFVLCQYVFEYLPDPAKALERLVKLVRPGGKLLLVDCDGIGTTFWPTTPELEKGSAILLKLLARTGFDAFVGRKLFSLMAGSGLKDLQVTTFPYLCAGGRVDAVEEGAWRQRFEALGPYGVEAFGSAEAWNLFIRSYLAMLADETSFKFILGVAVQGTGP